MSKRRIEISLVESDSDTESRDFNQKRFKTNKIDSGKSVQMGSKGVNSPTSSKKDTTFGVSSNQPKKLVIKNMKTAPKLPDNFEEETWKKLQQAVLIIFNTNIDGPSTSNSTTSMQMGYSVEELYRAVEDLCSHKMGGNLYQRLQNQCEEHVKVVSGQLTGDSTLLNNSSSTSVTSLDNITYLTIVNNSWVLFCKQLIMIRSIFLYLDRTYVLQQLNSNANLTSSNGISSVRSIWEMGMQIWRKFIAMNNYILPKCIQAIISLIQRERVGETVDRSLIKSMLRMFISLQIYGEVFESQFFENTQKFYEQEGITYVKERETADYLRHVEFRINEENERVLHYLDASSRKVLISILDKYLIFVHLETILSKGFDSLMDANRADDLKRLYSLFSRVNIPVTLTIPSSSVDISINGGSLEKLKLTFKSYIKATGTLIVNDPEKESTMVQEILNLKVKMDGIVESSFFKNETFIYALKEAFEGFINSRANKPAEMIAKYLDGLLRSGSKSARSVASNEDELESVMDKIIVIFRYIQGKDIFEAFYKKDLAKRLLLGKSQSLDAEKSMISKLKSECGSSFTTKLEGMFKDINISKDLMDAFRARLSDAPPSDIEMNVFVLTQGYWPPYPQVDIILPLELSTLQETYKSFYLSKHNGRRVTWQNSLGHCLVRSFFPTGKKELQLSLFQTVVLLVFNDSSITNGLSFKDIKERVGIEHGELSRTLLSLTSGKVKVLLRSTNTPMQTSQDPNAKQKEQQIEEEDIFTFNKSFKHKLFRIKVNTIQLKETVDENQKTTASVFQDRQYQIDAAIVRIMKTRKTLNHQQLVAELYQQLKFPVKPTDLKKRIESLIEREYLERDNDNSQIYRYLA